MRTRSIILAILAVPLLLAGSAWYGLLHTEPGARWLWAQAEHATGGALTARSISGDLASGLSVSQLAFAADGVHVSAALVTVDADIDLIPLTVSVGAAQVSGLTVELRDTGEQEIDPEKQAFRLDQLQLPFVLAIAELRLDEARVVSDAGATIAAIDSATFAGRWADAIGIENLDLRMPGIGASGEGRLQLDEPYGLGIDVRVIVEPELTGLSKPLPVQVAVEGPLDDFAIDARSDAPQVNVTGRVAGITRSIRWDLALEAPSATMPPEAGLSELPPISVFAEASGGTSDFTFDATVGFAGTSSTAMISADVDIEAGTLKGDVDWNNAQWPPSGPDPRVASRRGKLAVSGSLNDWRVDGTVQLSVPDLPAGQFTVSGGGDLDGADVQILEGNVLGGSLAGRVAYRWRKPQTWSANLDLQNIETDALTPDWPATLSGHLDVSGQPQPFVLTAGLRDVRGKFREKPLRANGVIDFRDGIVTADDLSLTHGDSSLQIDGGLYSADGLRYSASVDELGDYLDGAFGEVSASGVISLGPQDPYLEIRASSPELGYRDAAVVGLEIADRGRGADMMNVELTASEARYGGFTASELRVRTLAAQQAQSIEVAFTSNGLSTLLELTGRLDDWNTPSRWSGQVRQLELEHAEFSASLASAADIELTPRNVEVEDLCLASERGISLCADSSWSDTMGAELAATLSSVPAGLVNAFVDTALQFDQVLNGELDWRLTKQGKSSGLVDVSMTSGTVTSRARPDMKLETGDAGLRFRIDSNSLRSGVLDLPLPGLGLIAAEFDVLDVAGDGSAALRGTINVDAADISFVEAVIPVLDDVSGNLVADLDIAGSITEPAVTGEIALEGGSLSYLPIGLRLTQLSLESELEGRGEIEMTGAFMAGEGRGRIRTRTNHLETDRRGLEIRLQGENLTLIDVPDLRAVADTDVAIAFDGKSLQLGGRVDVPHARIRPRDIGIGRVSESEDVVIVRGELPEGSGAKERGNQVLINGSVEIALGNDVVVDLDVADAYVTGSTTFTWDGPPMPTANGRYVVKGEILAYGQKLVISEGAVRFPDVPANDPLLRIRAEREIFGNSQVRRAGILVSGPASRPMVEAYTTPLTTEERALTLLVTGSEFDYEKGIGAFDFGTYIAPRVYASYGIGLFDQANVIRVRYDLTEGLGVTLTSGARDEGVDLTYRISN